MAKKNIVIFTDSDMPKPKKLASGLIGLRAPVDFQVYPGKTAHIDLQTRANCLLFTGDSIIPTGTNIVINVKNDGETPESYMAGDVIARAFPLFPEEFEIK